MGPVTARTFGQDRSLYAAPMRIDASELPRCFFYHTTELPGLGVQDGGWDLRGRFDDYIGGTDLRKKRVLDVGTASGFLSFEAEAHGAREVVSFDLDNASRQDLLPFADSDYVNNHKRWTEQQSDVFLSWKRAYWLTHRLKKSSSKVFYGDIYDLPQQLGQFDVVIFGAVLEHLIDPLSAMFKVSQLASDIIVINTDYFDHAAPIALFNGRVDRPDNSFVFWTYTISVYDEYMKIMGFKKIGERKGAFAGTRPAPGAPRPMLERVALVYQRNG